MNPQGLLAISFCGTNSCAYGDVSFSSLATLLGAAFGASFVIGMIMAWLYQRFARTNYGFFFMSLVATIVILIITVLAGGLWLAFSINGATN